MLRFLFWNLNKKNLSSLIVQAMISRRLDFAAFCEPGDDLEHVPAPLKGNHFLWRPPFGPRLRMLTRFPPRYLRTRVETDRYSLIEVRLPVRESFFLMLVHAPSRASQWGAEALADEAADYARELRRIEAEAGHTRSLVVGDFNMQPFDAGVYGARGFHAVADRRDARKPRTVQRTVRPRRYNPMWNLLGDETPGPPATLYHAGSTPRELGWHLFDQVLVGPDLIDGFGVPSLAIVDRIGDTPLTTRSGRPRRGRLSDHLPLYFEFTV
ncbi:endonuclease/exonuclease/phosphatase family protein [Alienimonas sp. DA493]|uniref:endonuclease/exonuclease/phosphatase family protein n=1 Tax=Alienimonas sp. DA493 TaxID=3373605 RepID=UPI003754B3DF